MAFGDCSFGELYEDITIPYDAAWLAQWLALVEFRIVDRYVSIPKLVQNSSTVRYVDVPIDSTILSLLYSTYAILTTTEIRRRYRKRGPVF